MPEIIIADHHDQVYGVWEERGARNLSVAHVDFHCDMRGLMIDRPKGEAYFTSKREASFVDRGNYLAHAIMNGMVSDLRWVHDAHGGRGHDVGPVVHYESDPVAPLLKIKQRRSKQRCQSLTYSECLFSDWEGPSPGEQLDLDWDALASVEYDDALKTRLIEGFLNQDFKAIPQTTFLIYSPGYSDPDRTLFEDFATRLADTFSADIVRLPQQELNTDGERFSGLKSFARRALPPQIRQTKRAVTKWVRQKECANDIGYYAH